MAGAAAARLLVSALPGERRVALVAGGDGADFGDGTLRDLIIERADAPPQAGDLYRARVTRIEPGLEAAFLSLGGGADGFLPLAKSAARLLEGETVTVRVTRAGAFDQGPGGPTPGTKAAKVTARLTPEDEARLADPDRTGLAAGPGLLRRGEDAVAGLLAARPEERPDEIVVEGLAAYQALGRGLAARGVETGAAEAPVLRLHQGPLGLFEAAGLEAEIEALLAPRVALPSGGALVIEPVGSMVAVDVDSGGGAGAPGGARRLAQGVNKEAAAVLVRQLRLRALSGLIVVDFLEAGDRAARQAFVGMLRRFFNRDPQPVQVLGMSASGLVEIQRRRGRPALHEILTEPLGGIDGAGAGRRKRPLTLAFEALRALPAAARAHPGRALTLRAAPAVIAALADGEAGATGATGAASAARAEVEARLGFKIALEAGGKVRVEERFTIAPA